MRRDVSCGIHARLCFCWTFSEIISSHAPSLTLSWAEFSFDHHRLLVASDVY